MKVSGIEVLTSLVNKKDYIAGTEFRLIKEDETILEVPFLEKNRILHTDGHSLYNLIGEAPTIDLILNYDFEIIEKVKLPKKINIPDIESVENKRILRAEIKINGILEYLEELKGSEK